MSLFGKQDDQTGEAKVLINGPTMYISTYAHCLGNAYHFLIWSAEQCLAYSKSTFVQTDPEPGIIYSSA